MPAGTTQAEAKAEAKAEAEAEAERAVTVCQTRVLICAVGRGPLLRELMPSCRSTAIDWATTY